MLRECRPVRRQIAVFSRCLAQDFVGGHNGAMPPSDFAHVSAACAAAFLAGAINSVAGGGTLVSFPTLLWLGVASITANATSTVAIWPGSLGSIWGFRRELAQVDPKMRTLAIACLAGGGAGALLLRITPPSLFEHLVPFLVLFATILFTVQAPIQARLRERTSRLSSGIWMPGAAALLFLMAVYGGYFGAGASIMMLSALSILGMTDILKMSALTSFYSLCFNAMAALVFISAGMVYWPYVLPMAIAAIIGGYGAAGVARRIGRGAVRGFVIAVGFTISVVMLVRTF
jgi:uncharacterized membrane protein YfcA